LSKERGKKKLETMNKVCELCENCEWFFQGHCKGLPDKEKAKQCPWKWSVHPNNWRESTSIHFI